MSFKKNVLILTVILMAKGALAQSNNELGVSPARSQTTSNIGDVIWVNNLCKRLGDERITDEVITPLSLAISKCPQRRDYGKIAEAYAILETADFLADYTGTFSDKDRNPEEYIRFGPDRSVTIRYIRQVGSNDSEEIPFPTVCSYIKKGTLINVVERSEDMRDEYLDYATHKINFAISRVELVSEDSHTISNPHCHNFARRERGLLNQYQKGKKTIYSELLDNNNLRFHTSGGGDYVKGKPRTESTLDEVFTRVN